MLSSSLLVQVWPSVSTRGIPVLNTLYKKATLPSLLPPLILIYFYEMPLELFSILYLCVDQLSGLTHKNISCVRAGTSPTVISQHPAQSLAESRWTVNVCWMNECVRAHTHTRRDTQEKTDFIYERGPEILFGDAPFKGSILCQRSQYPPRRLRHHNRCRERITGAESFLGKSLQLF